MLIGIDEVGRGCWAGPLVAAAVGFEAPVHIADLADSKLLSSKKRVHIAELIKNETSHIGIGWVWPREINALGLTEAVRLAMQRAASGLVKKNSQVVIDGNINYLDHFFCHNKAKQDVCQTICANISTLVRADASVPAVSAASIIAKVARDTYMAKVGQKYPQYGFESHVGYGTKQHLSALKEYGVLPLHRINYKPVQQLLREFS